MAVDINDDVLEVVQVALVEDYQRNLDRVTSMSENDDLYREAERDLKDSISKMVDYTKIRVEEKRVENEKEIDMAKLEAEIENQKSRFDVEELRAKTQLEVEERKQQITWKKVAYEYGKALLPIMLSNIMFNSTYFKALGKVHDFESDYSYTTTPGRQLGMPRLSSMKRL